MFCMRYMIVLSGDFPCYRGIGSFRFGCKERGQWITWTPSIAAPLSPIRPHKVFIRMPATYCFSLLFLQELGKVTHSRTTNCRSSWEQLAGSGGECAI